MNAVSFFKTRIAPTPSGYLHLGNACSFLLTAGWAKRAGAKLLLRIDDLDRERTQPRYVEDIFETLRFLQIKWDEGPQNATDYQRQWSQVHRLPFYETALQQLQSGRQVFACTCSRTQLHQVVSCQCRSRQLPLDAPNACWRLITDAGLPLAVKTMSGDTITATLPASMQSFVVRKKDGAPAYQLASLVDDEYFGIDAIVRGQDLWDSTLAQQYLAAVLQKSFFSQVLFLHHPLLMEAGGQRKLSKSAGDTSVLQMRFAGKSIAELRNIIEKWMIASG